jgi:hypothetical protein
VINWTQKSVLGHAAIKRYIAASREAWERLTKAKSKSEKVKAIIDFVVAAHQMSMPDRDQRAKEIIDLIDSEIPLDREGRREISENLRLLLFPKPIDRRRQYCADLSDQAAHADMMKDFVREGADLSATEAEQEVARYFGIDVETLKKRKLRAKRAVDEEHADRLGIDVETLKKQRLEAERAMQELRELF